LRPFPFGVNELLGELAPGGVRRVGVGRPNVKAGVSCEWSLGPPFPGFDHCPLVLVFDDAAVCGTDEMGVLRPPLWPLHVVATAVRTLGEDEEVHVPALRTGHVVAALVSLFEELF